MHKIVLNLSKNPFALTIKAGEWIYERDTDDNKKTIDNILSINKSFNYAIAYSNIYGILSQRKRANKLLIDCITILGDKASDNCDLKVIEFEGDKFIIDNSFGHEILETPKSIEWEDWDDWKNEKVFKNESELKIKSEILFEMNTERKEGVLINE